MPTRGESVTLTYTALDTVTVLGQLNDAANHTLHWFKDGVDSTPTNTPTDTGVQGECNLVITAEEADCALGRLTGTSSTSSVLIIPVQVSFEISGRWEGAHPVTINILDEDSVSVPSAYVSIVQSGVGYPYQGNVGGVVTAALEYGTYTVIVTKAGKDLKTQEIDVDADHLSFDITLVANTIPLPSDPANCMVSFVALRGGTILQNQKLIFELNTTIPGSGNVTMEDVREYTTSNDGLVNIELYKSTRWQCFDEAGKSFTITVPDASTYLVPNANLRR